MKKVQKQKKATLESLWAYLDESSKRSELEFKKMREEAKQRSKEIDRQIEEAKKRSKEIDRQMEETRLQMKETDEKIREVSRQLGDIGNSNGDVAEDYFQNAFYKNPKLNGEIYDKMDFNLKHLPKNGQKGDEYDIVMVNKKSVAIIEVKYNLKKNNTKDALSKTLNKIDTFKALYPEYKNHKFYLGLASWSFTKGSEKDIQEAGVAVIKQVGDKMVINSENLKVF